MLINFLEKKDANNDKKIGNSREDFINKSKIIFSAQKKTYLTN